MSEVEAAVTVIISVYKNRVNLRAIFDALNDQSYKNFEVVVAEDNDAKEMKSFVEECRKIFTFKIQHVFQEDDGFRKCRALNQAIRVAKGKVLVFLDGDCLPHKELVGQYLESTKSGQAMVGRRVMLNDDFSKKVLSKDVKISFFNLVINRNKRVEEGIYCPFLNRFVHHNRGIWGCNWGVLKKDIEAINGFDEDYVRAGIGEDTDIEWRLKQNGITLQSMKYKAIVYHLHHPENYSSTLENEELFSQKKLENKTVCKNGLVNY